MLLYYIHRRRKERLSLSTSMTGTSLKQGWLEKKGSLVKNWKRRFFVLTSSSLDYFTDETLAEKKGSVPILSSSRVMHRDGTSHKFKFGLLTGKRLLEIACTSDRDRDRWTKAIQDVINRIQVESMRSGKPPPNNADKSTIFDDIIAKNRIEVSNMVEDTPMNRARKKQLAVLQKSGLDTAASGLKKDDHEKALWGGDDSDESEDEKSDEEEIQEGSRPKTSAATRGKTGTRRRLGGKSSKVNTRKMGSSKSKSRGNSFEVVGEEKGSNKTAESQTEDQGVDTSDRGDSLDEWEERHTDDGVIYYYHKEAKLTRWDKPSAEVRQSISRRLDEERRQRESATEKRLLEQKQNKFVEEELREYTNQIKDDVDQQIKLWKHPVGKKKPRVLGELINAIPSLLGPTVIPPESSLVVKPLQKGDSPSEVKKAYRRAVRLVHPDKIAGSGCVIEMEKKLLAAEVFIVINEAFDQYRTQHEDA